MAWGRVVRDYLLLLLFYLFLFEEENAIKVKVT